MSEPTIPGDVPITNHRRSLAFAVCAMAFFMAFTHDDVLDSQNTLSRYVAVESLVERGEFHIDDCARGPRWIETRDGEPVYVLNDMVFNQRDRHFYSSKPPVFTLILAGVMRALRTVQPDLSLSGDGASKLAFLLTWLVVGGVSAAGFYAFRRKTGEILPAAQADVVTILTLGGTLFLTYSVTMNHHTVTAALILMSFFLLGMADPRRDVSEGRVMLAGLLMGLATVIDIGHGGAFALAFGLYLLLYVRSLRAIVFFGLGSVGPLAVHCIVQYRLWGTILPVQLIDGTKNYPLSYWKHKLPPDTWKGMIPRWKYWLLTLFSARGLFVLSPVLLFGVAALARDVARGIRGIREVDRPEAGRAWAGVCVTFAIAILAVYHWFHAPTNFAGSCYGFRWFIGFTPVLAFYAVVSFARIRGEARLRRYFCVLGGISVFFALIGMQYTWTLMEANPHPAIQVLVRVLRGFDI